MAIVKATAINNDKLEGSINNQYRFYNGTQPVAKYMKTVAYSIVGMRINPNTPVNEPELMDFLLRTHTNDFATAKYGKGWREPDYYRFNYANDVIELYSAEEVEMFKHYNKSLLDNGVLVEYDNTENGKVAIATPPEDEEAEVAETPDKTITFGAR